MLAGAKSKSNESEGFLGSKIKNKQADQYPQMVTIQTHTNLAMPKFGYSSIKPVLSDKVRQ